MLRVEIITVTEREFLLRRRVGRMRGWCSRCGAEGVMITAEEAAAICDVSLGRVYGWIEAGEAHCEEGEDFSVRICLASLIAPAALNGCELRIGEGEG
ncbi:MAG: hypothetical protein KF868_08480 [Acidobacteria bacterium]|nr:hypothetical protein [Acidobacteriota bacterium]MCW5970743.1 hypothetical protein [Blastocatellales bacterium]